MIIAWLESARWCGSGRNSQPWRFISVRSRASLERLSRMGEYTSHLEHCAVALVVASLRCEPEFSRCFDLGRICQSLMLLAAADGVESCPAVFEPLENRLEAKALLAVPPELELDLAIALGVRDQSVGSEPRGPSPKGRLPVPVLLSEERYDGGANDAVR
jgi:nitroreductase